MLKSLSPDASMLPAPQATAPLSDGRIWNDYVALPAGRMHVRRAGTRGRPLLLFPSGGGSSETFAPVIHRLARTHQVVATDYLGNGESDTPEREVTIETLAQDAKELADALGFDSMDLWGSHTGALIAMEFAVRHPQRIGRASSPCRLP
jgi:pimeloyl-ACP methyl ester carboxylesterase